MQHRSSLNDKDSNSAATNFTSERPFRNWFRESQRPPHCFCRPMVPVMISSGSQDSVFVRPAVAGGEMLHVPIPQEDGRLRKHADYQRVYKATRKQFSSSMAWFAAMRAPLPEKCKLPAAFGPRVGLTAGKVLGKAHERNRIKRRMREVVRHHLHELPPGIDLILHPKRSVIGMDFAKLDSEVLRIFRQARAQAAAQSPRKPDALESTSTAS